LPQIFEFTYTSLILIYSKQGIPAEYEPPDKIQRHLYMPE